MEAYLPTIKLVWIFFPGVMEVETQLCFNADPEVVVHHEDLGVFFARGNSRDYKRKKF